ncbi:MAG: acyl-CoA/acyl-ACP dehydrogenase, partial [Deltaproteobacteria bacterium]|nr:acyl-CoA/acyl-ACP dehydrogenase [Deltaproteobacteria bacterium]
MDFSYSEDQQAVRELARQILGDRSDVERAKKIEAEPECFDRELWKDLAEASLLGIAIPEEYGGMGFGMEELCILFEELGRTLAALPLYPSLALGALSVSEFGSAEQRESLLPGVVTGETILSAALSEAGSSDPCKPRVTATPYGDGGQELSGEKVCVPAAHLAHRVLIPAREGENDLGLFLVDPQAPGVTLEREVATNGEPLFTLRLAGARVAPGDRLGHPAQGRAMVEWLRDRALVVLCATQVGLVEEALRSTAEYTSERKQFGKPIATFQGVAMRAADAFIDVEAMRATMVQAAWRLASGLPASKEVVAAKWWASRGGHRVVHTAQHLHGGMGADIDYPIHRYFLCWKQLDLCLGSSGRHMARLG